MKYTHIKRGILFLCLAFLFACKKNKCVVCTAQNPNGRIAKNAIECDKDGSFLDGFVDGFKQYYKDNGDTVAVICDFEN